MLLAWSPHTPSLKSQQGWQGFLVDRLDFPSPVEMKDRLKKLLVTAPSLPNFSYSVQDVGMCFAGPSTKRSIRFYFDAGCLCLWNGKKRSLCPSQLKPEVMQPPATFITRIGYRLIFKLRYHISSAFAFAYLPKNSISLIFATINLEPVVCTMVIEGHDSSSACLSFSLRFKLVQTRTQPCLPR